MKTWMLMVLVGVAACDEPQEPRHWCDLCDAPGGSVPPACDPLQLAGYNGCQPSEKCTWIIDSTVPEYVGHIGCVPDGTKTVGDACTYGAAGATGYDDCQKGGVCSAFGSPGTPGVCQEVCDLQGGSPMCDASHGCVAHGQLFSRGTTGPPAAAGVCDQGCDPLADNDFDGSGSALSRTGSACGSATIGCYGTPSYGRPLPTVFTCMPEEHYDLPLRHGTPCSPANGCTQATNDVVDINSCNEGYEPLFHETTGVTVSICVAMCAPLDCYAGHCGSNDENALGAAPHRCASPDAVGTFGSDEECEYLWDQEIDGQGHVRASMWSDRVGFCFDHSKRLYDPTGGTNYTTPLPSCKDVPLHGSGSELDAVDLGCVSTTTAGLSFAGKPRVLPRTLSHREMR